MLVRAYVMLCRLFIPVSITLGCITSLTPMSIGYLKVFIATMLLFMVIYAKASLGAIRCITSLITLIVHLNNK